MTPMRGRRNTGGCGCRDCGNDEPISRAQEKREAQAEAAEELWRVGNHYGIHVYEGDRPVATFHNAEDAGLAVAAVNQATAPEVTHTARHQLARVRDARGQLAARHAGLAAECEEPGRCRVRLILKARGRTFDMEWSRDEAPTPEPRPQGDVYASTERDEVWDHDQRAPVGFSGDIRAMPGYRKRST
jgi:hypothetical protein